MECRMRNNNFGIKKIISAWEWSVEKPGATDKEKYPGA